MEKIDYSHLPKEAVVPHENTIFTGYLKPKNTNIVIYFNGLGGTINKEKGSYDYSTAKVGATATPADGYVFDGWYDQENNLISILPAFSPSIATHDMVLTAKFRIKENGNAAYFRVKTEGTGSISGPLGDSQYLTINPDGTLSLSVTATPAEGYTFSGWELERNNQTLTLDYDSPVISANDPGVYFVKGDMIKAVFKKVTVIDSTIPSVGGTTISSAKKKELTDWLESLKSDSTVSASKTAEVYDYDNRIYKIEIDAETTLSKLMADIDMAFILDVSNSMLFPAKLTKTGETMVLTQTNLNAAYSDNGPYYIISNPEGLATVYKIFKEDGIWYYDDASHLENQGKKKVTISTTFDDPESGGPYAYPIYTAEDTNQRKYYLNQSMSSTISSMKSIIHTIKKAGGSTGGINIAYNTFASELLSDQRQDFTKLTENTSDTYINVSQTKGGTRQDLALDDATNNFTWKAGDGNRYAILITDGAPNYSADQEWVRKEVVDKATALKNSGVKLVTVGLSTKNVTNGSKLLSEIASDGLFFEAENADDLQYVLLDILQKIMTDHILVSGTVEDTLDPAFYPVLSDGTPVQSGKTYLLNKSAPDKLDPYESNIGEQRYTWTKSGDQWSVKWENVNFGWGDEHFSGMFKGVFYAKAKEDFLGGNKIPTNVGNATVNPAWWYNSSEETWSRFTSPTDQKQIEQQPTIQLSTPYVNVDELHLTKYSTEWTVYLGTEVTPENQMKALWNEIKVRQVVKDGGTTADGKLITAADRMFYSHVSSVDSEDEAAPGSGYAALPISKYFSDTEFETLLTNLKTNNAAEKTIDYTAYGHTPGTITVKLEKGIDSGASDASNKAPESHVTDKVGERVETYKITVAYTPSTEGASETYENTTPDGTAGKITTGTGADEVKSENEHIVNVIALPLSIKKVDADGTTVISDKPAKFALYRTARQGEEGSKKLNSYDSTLGDDYIQVAELTTSNGMAALSSVPLLPDGAECYWLVETQAPTNYARLPGAVKVNLSFTDSYTLIGNTPAENRPASGAYNWTQTASLTTEGTELSDYVTLSGTEFTIKNEPVRAKIVLTKTVVDLPGTDNYTDAMYFVIKDKATGEYLKSDGTLAKITTNSDGTIDTGLGEAKKYFFKDFKMINGNGNERYVEITFANGIQPNHTYIIEEIGRGKDPYDVTTTYQVDSGTVVTGTGAEITTSNETTEVKFTNTYTTKFYVTKEWKLGNGQQEFTESKTIYFQVHWIHKNGTENIDEVYPKERARMASGIDANAVGSVTYDTNTKTWNTAHISGLVPFIEVEGKYYECQYYVVETDKDGNALSDPYYTVSYSNKHLSEESSDAKAAAIRDDYREVAAAGNRTITIINTTPLTEISIKKVGETSQALSGAVFKLTNGSNIVPVTASGEGVIVEPKTSGETVTITDNTFTIPAGGVIIKNVPASDTAYSIVEVSAPAGYVITNNTPASFTYKAGVLNESHITGVSYMASGNEFSIPNTPGVELPATGGPGTGLIYLIGTLLTLFAFAGLLVKIQKTA